MLAKDSSDWIVLCTQPHSRSSISLSPPPHTPTPTCSFRLFCTEQSKPGLAGRPKPNEAAEKAKVKATAEAGWLKKAEKIEKQLIGEGGNDGIPLDKASDGEKEKKDESSRNKNSDKIERLKLTVK